MVASVSNVYEPLAIGGASETPGAIRRRISKLAVVDLPDLRNSGGGIVTFQVPHGVGDMPRHVGQYNSPTNHIRPGLWPECTNEPAICDPCSQDLTRSWVGFDFRWYVEVSVWTLFGSEHGPILA